MAHEVFPKWVIKDGYLKLGKVTKHSQLINSDDIEVQGGGRYEVEHRDTYGIILLYGSSSDYGYASIKDVTTAIHNGCCEGLIHTEGPFEDFIYFYSTQPKLHDAQKDKVQIEKPSVI